MARSKLLSKIIGQEEDNFFNLKQRKNMYKMYSIFLSIFLELFKKEAIKQVGRLSEKTANNAVKISDAHKQLREKKQLINDEVVKIKADLSESYRLAMQKADETSTNKAKKIESKCNAKLGKISNKTLAYNSAVNRLKASL